MKDTTRTTTNDECFFNASYFFFFSTPDCFCINGRRNMNIQGHKVGRKKTLVRIFKKINDNNNNSPQVHRSSCYIKQTKKKQRAIKL